MSSTFNANNSRTAYRKLLPQEPASRIVAAATHPEHSLCTDSLRFENAERMPCIVRSASLIVVHERPAFRFLAPFIDQTDVDKFDRHIALISFEMILDASLRN
jgi:hypothetical protein